MKTINEFLEKNKYCPFCKKSLKLDVKNVDDYNSFFIENNTLYLDAKYNDPKNSSDISEEHTKKLFSIGINDTEFKISQIDKNRNISDVSNSNSIDDFFDHIKKLKLNKNLPYSYFNLKCFCPSDFSICSNYFSKNIFGSMNLCTINYSNISFLVFDLNNDVLYQIFNFFSKKETEINLLFSNDKISNKKFPLINWDFNKQDLNKEIVNKIQKLLILT